MLKNDDTVLWICPESHGASAYCYILLSPVHLVACWVRKHNVVVYEQATDNNKKAVLPQGNRAMPQVFFSVEVRQQHSLQV